MAKKQSFADKASKSAKAGMKTVDGEDVLQIVKVRTFVQKEDGHLRLVSKTVKITASNQNTIFGG